MKKTLVLLLFVLMVGCLSVPVSGIPHDPVLQFGSWTPYTENDYSQGIAYIEVLDNSTKTAFALQENLTSGMDGCQVNASCSVQLIIGYVANRTHLGFDAGIPSLGRNYLQFNVSVVHENGTEIFTQQNGTYVSNHYIGNELFVFEHSVILNFETEYSAVYDVSINYDYYEGGGFIKDYLYWNDMSNTTWTDYADNYEYSDGDLYTWNKTNGGVSYARTPVMALNMTAYTIRYELSITYMHPQVYEVDVLARNDTTNHQIQVFYTTGVYTWEHEELSSAPYLDNITRFYIRTKSLTNENNTSTIDYFNVFVYNKAEYAYYNDMSNTSWVDNSLYCAVNDGGTTMLIEDDEGGHTYAEAKDYLFPSNISLVDYPYIEIYLDEGTADQCWDEFGVRIYWTNGTTKNVWNHVVVAVAGVWIGANPNRYELNILQYCNPSHTEIYALDLICWGDDDLGDDLEFDYLNIYDKTSWSTQTITFTLTAELFEGMLLAGISLLGLAMIPGGSVFGAMLIKTKKLNEKTWMIPVAIVLLGFAFFIGGMA